MVSCHTWAYTKFIKTGQNAAMCIFYWTCSMYVFMHEFCLFYWENSAAGPWHALYATMPTVLYNAYMYTCQKVKLIMARYRISRTTLSSSGVVVRSTGACKRLSGHPAGPVLGWVSRVKYPVPKHYTCQAVWSGFRESFSWLSTFLRMRRKIEVSPT